MNSRLSLLLIGMLVLAGCAGTAPRDIPAASAGWEATRSQLLDFTHWEARGKIAVRSTGQAESANLKWQQVDSDSHLELSGPMGLSATTVDSDGQYITIRRGEEQQRWALDDPAFNAQNPVQLPLAALHFWLKGIPSPALPLEALAVDPGSQLPLRLQQQGWSVEFQQFGQFGAYRLPTRIEVARDSTRARIILRDWSYPGIDQ